MFFNAKMGKHCLSVWSCKLKSTPINVKNVFKTVNECYTYEMIHMDMDNTRCFTKDRRVQSDRTEYLQRV